MLGREDEKMYVGFFIFKISSRILVLLVGRLSLRPGSLKKSPGRISPGCGTGWDADSSISMQGNSCMISPVFPSNRHPRR